MLIKGHRTLSILFYLDIMLALGLAVFSTPQQERESMGAISVVAALAIVSVFLILFRRSWTTFAMWLFTMGMFLSASYTYLTTWFI